MTRGLSASNLTAIAAAHVRPIEFWQLTFDGGTERLHNAVGTYTWGGFDWQGIGALGESSGVEEGLDLSPYAVSLRLNALNATLFALVTGESVYRRPAIQYVGYLDANGVLVADPQVNWSGFMDHVKLRRGIENSIVLICEDDDARIDQVNGALFTDEDQQRRYSGDVFFEFLSQMQDISLVWGPGGQTARLGSPATPRGPGPGAPAPRSPGNTAAR